MTVGAIACRGRHCRHDLYCHSNVPPRPYIEPVPMPVWPVPSPQCTCGVFYHSVIPLVCPVHPGIGTLTITCDTISSGPAPSTTVTIASHGGT